ncbi:MAG: hypothetical protein LLG04_07320 [Parachlamydia sp.]|nr:hypothetical protein [Parachlamydia sp.]
MLLIVTLFLFQSTSLMAIAQRYQLVDLGLSAYTSSDVVSINENGVVCGYLMDGKTSRIFVIDSSNKKLALRQEDFFSYRLKINNNNEIFGSFAHRTGDAHWYFSEELVFKWINPFNFIQYFNFKHVGYPKGRRTTSHNFKPNVFWDANDLGQILVMDVRSYSTAMDETGKNGIWLYDNKEFQKIENPGFEAGFRLNNRGEILGCYHTGSVLKKNRLAHVSVYNYPAHSVRKIDLPGDAVGQDINDQGQVVGNFYHPQEQMIIGFLAAATGEYTPLINFWPYRMNNLGQVVGEYLYEKKGQPAVWDSGECYDLSVLTGLKDDRGNVWDSLDTLNGINDKGEIIGNGTINGKTHAFVLKPI